MTTTSSSERVKKKPAKALDNRTVNVLTAPRTLELLDAITAVISRIPARPVLDEVQFRTVLRQILDEAYRRGVFTQEMEDALGTMGHSIPMSFYRTVKPVRARGRRHAPESNEDPI